MSEIKHYYLSTPFAKDSKAPTEEDKNLLVSNLWALFTALETVEYSARNLAEHKKQLDKKLAKYNRDMKRNLFGAKLQRLQSEKLTESVLNSSASCIEAMGHALTIPDEHLDEFLSCLENKAKELNARVR